MRRSVPCDELYWRTGRNIFDDCLQNPIYDNANISTFNVACLKLEFVSTFIRRLRRARLPVVNKKEERSMLISGGSDSRLPVN